MHIPDGYLSPATCVVFYGAMAPVWYLSARKVERSLKLRQTPLLALAASFTFVIMMFNIPIPGGSTGHMVGTAVVAIVLGPWVGIMALSLALTLQAFLFADGGITTLGANCFNMAFLMSFSGYAVFTLLASGSVGPVRRFIAAATSGYVAVNVAAFAVAVELGVQPIIASGADGLPLYAPYPLTVAVPVMMASHLLFFGPVEAVGTGLIIGYAYRVTGGLIEGVGAGGLNPHGTRSLWAALALLILLTPLGLIAASTPWGEWGAEELSKLLGYLPGGMEKLGGFWKGLMPGYSIPGSEGAVSSVLAYVAAAAIGSLLTVAVVYFITRVGRRIKEEQEGKGAGGGEEESGDKRGFGGKGDNDGKGGGKGRGARWTA